MRRLFWMGVGAVGTIVVAQRVRRQAQRFTPDGVAGQAVEAGRRTGRAVQEAVGEFRAAATERERDLVTALLVEPEGGSVAERRAVRAAAGSPVTRPVVDDDEDDFF